MPNNNVELHGMPSGFVVFKGLWIKLLEGFANFVGVRLARPAGGCGQA